MKRMTLQQGILAALVMSVLAVGCGKTEKTDAKKTGGPEAGHGADNAGGGHPSKGPNGGAIFEFAGGGGHDYHGEVVHDDDKETVTIYILDESGKKNVPIDAKEIVVNFKAHDKQYQAKLKAMPMEGEKEGMSSRFVTGKDHDSEELVEHFDDEDLKPEVVVTINKTQYRGKIEAHKDEEGSK